MSPIDFEVKPRKAIVLNCGRKNILDDLSNSGSPFDYLVKAGNRPPRRLVQNQQEQKES